ncbi:TetR/AcrR family transcriptional regulator [Phenylobacterium montanum]|uniref:TetR/AcrR family transcriptional regulator n=1 Tax=Phenylobacterium montanum TaxID=2823693 RepID=A0A975IVR3_9CAUL|nr:TetR/AcrR family transcriptional regulator [Caulobacter sp. S6]QUD89040.1 TetR/AcrR family transcriptional regulator [Caulobacter sp. S6]
MTLTAVQPVKSARKAKGDGHLRRAEILRAAETIFVRDGYQGATIRKIADEVGVSSTALYMHFRDKDEILLEIAETMVGQLLASNTEIAGRPLDAVTKVRLMLAAYMRFGLENPNAYRLVYLAKSDEEGGPQNERLTDISARCYEAFHGAVAEIEADGRLGVGKSDIAAHVLWSACHGLVALRITRTQLAWEDNEVLMSTMLDGIFDGLLTR